MCTYVLFEQSLCVHLKTFRCRVLPYSIHLMYQCHHLGSVLSHCCSTHSQSMRQWQVQGHQPWNIFHFSKSNRPANQVICYSTHLQYFALIRMSMTMFPTAVTYYHQIAMYVGPAHMTMSFACAQWLSGPKQWYHGGSQALGLKAISSWGASSFVKAQPFVVGLVRFCYCSCIFVELQPSIKLGMRTGLTCIKLDAMHHCHDSVTHFSMA